MSSRLWGVSILQFYSYYSRTGTKDRPIIRCIVRNTNLLTDYPLIARSSIDVVPCVSHGHAHLTAERNYRHTLIRILNTFNVIVSLHNPYYYLVTKYGNILSLMTNVWCVMTWLLYLTNDFIRCLLPNRSLAVRRPFINPKRIIQCVTAQRSPRLLECVWYRYMRDPLT
jgi:hypothetical protein